MSDDVTNIDTELLVSSPDDLSGVELAAAYRQASKLRGALIVCEEARETTASTSPDGFADRVVSAVRVLRGNPPSATSDDLADLARAAGESLDVVDERTEDVEEEVVTRLSTVDNLMENLQQ